MKIYTCLLLLACCLIICPIKAQVPGLNSYTPAKATIFVDFDGQFVSGSAWNYNGDINAAPAALSNAAIIEIMNRVAEDYRPFDVNITTDSTVYWAAPRNQRMRMIVTATSQWYGSTAGGVAYVGSFTWGDNTPAWVFASLLGNRPKWVAEAVSHEIGHTLGLQHQSSYDAACNKIAEYNTGLGTGEIGWAPIMGAGYYQNHTTWHNGPNTVNCSTIQNDFDIIRTNNGFGLRPDDHGDDNTTATNINMYADTFSVSGLINTAADQDVFKLVLARPTTLQLKAIPQNVGSGDDGANVDIKISLLNGNDTINSYNPSTLLNAGIDTNLNAGTYFIAVDGVGNIYHNDIGSIGLYNLTGNIITALPVKNIRFSGTVNNSMHQLFWSFQADETIGQLRIEKSADGQHFSPLAALSASAQAFSYQSLSNDPVYYRLKFITNLQQAYTSAVVVLKSKTPGSGIRLLAGNSNSITINTGGQLLGSGQLAAGINQVPCMGEKGLLLLHCSNVNQSFTQKLIKQ